MVAIVEPQLGRDRAGLAIYRGIRRDRASHSVPEEDRQLAQSAKCASAPRSMGAGVEPNACPGASPQDATLNSPLAG